MDRLSRSLFFVLALLLTVTTAATADPPKLESYIVVLNDRVVSPAAEAGQIAVLVGGQVGFLYEHALKGFSIRIPAQAVAALERNPNVKYVATDDIRYAFIQTVPTGLKRIYADSNTNLHINGTDDYRVDVDVAVIDTGVDFQHPDLNVAGGVNCTGNACYRSKHYHH